MHNAWQSGRWIIQSLQITSLGMWFHRLSKAINLTILWRMNCQSGGFFILPGVFQKLLLNAPYCWRLSAEDVFPGWNYWCVLSVLKFRSQLAQRFARVHYLRLQEMLSSERKWKLQGGGGRTSRSNKRIAFVHEELVFVLSKCKLSRLPSVSHVLPHTYLKYDLQWQLRHIFREQTDEDKLPSSFQESDWDVSPYFSWNSCNKEKNHPGRGDGI